MKKSMSIICLLAVCMMAVVFSTSCSKKAKSTLYCTSDRPYYCEGYDLCCPYPYLAAGTHYCYQYKSDCQAAGYYCVRCYKE